MDRNELRRNAAIDGLLGVLEIVDNAHVTAIDAQVEADNVLHEVTVQRRSLQMALASLGHNLGIPCQWDQDTHPTCLCTAEKQAKSGCRQPVPLPEGDVPCTWTEDDPACDCADWRRALAVAGPLRCKALCSCGQPAGPTHGARVNDGGTDGCVRCTS